MDDEWLFERIYCFEVREDVTHHLLGGRRRRVILKVHTLRKWRDRGDKLFLRANKVTAVKVMFFVWVVAAVCLPAAAVASPAERASGCKCTLFVVSASHALLLCCCICCFLFAAAATVHCAQEHV